MGSPDFVCFRDLTPEYVNRDFQVHTSFTDGEASVREVVKRAEEIGLKEIAFTEHVRRASSFYPGFAAEVTAVRCSSPVRIYLGIEVKVEDQNGTLTSIPK